MKNLIAHRGNNNNNAENRLQYLLNVLNYDYIFGIEIDIRKTLDNKLILSHNSYLKNNYGLYFISKTKYKDLIKYEYKVKNENFSVHTLNELLSKIQSTKIILLDIKDYIDIDLFYKTIKKYRHLNIYICSFNYKFVFNLKTKYPQLKVGIIIGYNMNRNKNIDIFDFISIHYNYVNDYNKNCFVWTINSPNLLNKIGKNIGIITDNSYKLKEHN